MEFFIKLLDLSLTMSKTLFCVLGDLMKSCSDGTLDETLDKNIAEYLSSNQLTLEDLAKSEELAKINCTVSNEDDVQWKFVCIVSYILLKISASGDENSDALMSVSQKSTIKSSFEFVVCLGIAPTLLKGVGIPVSKRCVHFTPSGAVKDPLTLYYRCRSLCNLMTELFNVPNLKIIIVTYYLCDYLAMLLQLSYAPYKKPTEEREAKKDDDFMTKDLWMNLQNDQIKYKDILEKVLNETYRPLVMKEIVILQGVSKPNPPAFLRKALSKYLSSFLISENGLLYLMKCFFDSPNIDTGAQWQLVETVKKLVCVGHGSLSIEEYLENICKQLKEVIGMTNKEDFTMLAAACISEIYKTYPDNKSVENLLHSLISPLIFNSTDGIPGTLILSSADISNTIDCINLCFIYSKLSLPIETLTPAIYSIFCIRTMSSEKMAIHKKLNNILLKYFSSKGCCHEDFFTSLILGTESGEMKVYKNVAFEENNESVAVKYANDPGVTTLETAINTLLGIIKELKQDGLTLAMELFVFCLNRMRRFEGIVNQQSREFLVHEDDVQDLLDEETENSLVILKVLENLASMDSVMKGFRSKPEVIVKFVVDFFMENTKNLKKDTEVINKEFITICLVLLISILQDNIDLDGSDLKRLAEPLKESLAALLKLKCGQDLLLLANEVNCILNKKKPSKRTSLFDQAMSEICDPLLPVRGHGLKQLTKLIRGKDPETMSKKHIVQCIFQENIKHEDSYIYLAAINGLARLANYFTEEVLEILTREFLNVDCKDNPEKECGEEGILNRIKVGEVLVKITKNLGEMAPLHKNILLNTFLTGCRDQDDLIRSSSLSNLAEVAQVLSYNLGSIIYELLKCINNVIENDKSPQCRRAAVMVITSLFKGLGTDSLEYLSESLKPIYRTLKTLYSDPDEDSVVKLQAQLALEELNSIVSTFLNPPIKMELKVKI